MASLFGHTASVIGFRKLLPHSVFSSKTLWVGILSAAHPDIDVIFYKIGLTFELFSHRGITHSVFYAFIWSILMIIIFHGIRAKHVLGLFLFYFVCTASHGVLDAMTTGGRGIMFWAPFSEVRIFFPWRPILVSPLGVSNFFSGWGWKVIVSESRYIGIPALIMYVIGIMLNKKIYSK